MLQFLQETFSVNLFQFNCNDLHFWLKKCKSTNMQSQISGLLITVILIHNDLFANSQD